MSAFEVRFWSFHNVSRDVGTASLKGNVNGNYLRRGAAPRSGGELCRGRRRDRTPVEAGVAPTSNGSSCRGRRAGQFCGEDAAAAPPGAALPSSKQGK